MRDWYHATSATDNEPKESLPEATIEELMPPIGDTLTSIRIFIRKSCVPPQNKPYFVPNHDRAQILEQYAKLARFSVDRERALGFANYFAARSAKDRAF